MVKKSYNAILAASSSAIIQLMSRKSQRNISTEWCISNNGCQLPSGAVPQIIRVKQRAVDSHVVTDPVDGAFDVLPPGVHRQQRVTATNGLTVIAGHAPL